MSQQIMDLVEKDHLKETPPEFEIGDTVEVHTKILEGDKERVQIFAGTVIARSGSGTRSRGRTAGAAAVRDEGVDPTVIVNGQQADTEGLRVNIRTNGLDARFFLIDLDRDIAPVPDGVEIDAAEFVHCGGHQIFQIFHLFGVGRNTKCVSAHCFDFFRHFFHAIHYFSPSCRVDIGPV